MGSVCCCFPVKDPGEILDGSSHENNIPPNSLIHNFLDKYTAFFSNAQMDALPSSHQEAASSTPNRAPENPEPESILAPPRTLAFDSDLRYDNVQRDGIVRALNKSAGVLQICSALRGGSVHIGQELVTESNCGEESKKCHSESPRKFSSENRKAGYLYDCPSPDDEDVCPTCLEGLLLHLA
uniref:Uncharacterized protein n=1 Tax=Fagus sylvatica TaxID=28930 RepID=A0A2N9EHU7_FAGSY